MDEFWHDYATGQLHIRDRWQFELKSDFTPWPAQKINTYTQEFYLFIPNALQVNEFTYSKEDFYRDQTNLIRYKTPEFTFKELLNPVNRLSPLQRLKTLIAEKAPEVESEIKLLGNVIRSALRDRVFHLVDKIETEGEKELNHQCQNLASEIDQVRTAFRKLLLECKAEWLSPTVRTHLSYVDEFVSNTIHTYLTGLLRHLRRQPAKLAEKTDDALCTLILDEQGYRQQHFDGEWLEQSDDRILYKHGLLNKFIIESLHLNTQRHSIQTPIGHLIGSFAAGIAMLVWAGFVVVFGIGLNLTTQAFILLSVVFYILKDRIKEGIRSLSFRKALKWFYDYKTKILATDDQTVVGGLKESFSFIPEERIPKEINLVRNREFHNILETFRRPEHIMYYKRTVSLKTTLETHDPRRHGLNILFRLNIYPLLIKASDPYFDYHIVEPETRKLKRLSLPKVYHLNIVIKSTQQAKTPKQLVTIEKYRLIIDKNGIKSIETI
ncbi:MAG: hypothetical protein KDK65_04875 [Chlamydiia bacterium]|nr:hypothetical protein [Chlamydiia bacterium]